MRKVLLLAILALGASLSAPTALAGAPTSFAEGNLLRVPEQFSTLGAAVAAAHPYDTILVGPGTYHEAITVHTPHLLIRGTDRNAVVLDGQHKLQIAIFVDGANGVEVDNMTAKDYQDNGFEWNNVTGFKGSYLTSYNMVNYGIYAFNSTVGEFTDDYASGNGDSGFYIGECYDCVSLITRVWAENNLLGYSGTNAGGVVITDSEWDNNAAGIVPNTLSSEQDYPQGGKKGNTISGNYVHNNNNLNAPSTFSIGSLGAPVGIGIEVAGGWNNKVIGNKVRNQRHYGIALHYLITPTMNNSVQFNDIAGTGYQDTDSAANNVDISWDGVGTGNCFDGNTDGGKPASTDPPTLETTNTCSAGGLPVGGDPGAGVLVALNAAGITDSPSPSTNQPAPGPKDSMPDSCAGAPASCRPAAQDARQQAPVVTAPPSAAEAIQPAPAIPNSFAQVAAGLQARPTAAEVNDAVKAAIASLVQAGVLKPKPLTVNVPATPTDVNGYLVAALVGIAALLLVGAGAGFWVRRGRLT